MLRTPYLVGENDFDQLNTIFRALGTPTEQDWPVESLSLSLSRSSTPLFFFFFWKGGREEVGILGNHVEEELPFQGHRRLADFLEFPRQPKQPLDMLFSAASDDAIRFLERCLTYDPRQRITSRQVSHFNLFIF